MAKLKMNFSQNPDVYITKQAGIRNQRPRIYKVHNHLFLNFFKVENLLHCVIKQTICNCHFKVVRFGITIIPLKPQQLKVHCTAVNERMKKTKKHKTITEKLDLLDRYEIISLVSQREAAERLGSQQRIIARLIKK